MANLLTLPDWATKIHLAYGFVDDFDKEDTARWTTTATDSGTSTQTAAAGGTIILAPSDGTVADNDEIYLLSSEFLLHAASKPIVVEARLKFTEANTDDANVAFGFMNAVAANSILDDGAGPAASYYGAVFYKVDGGTVWLCENSLGATQKTTTTSTTASGGSYQILRIEWRPYGDGTNVSKGDYVFYVDGVEVAKHKDQGLGTPTEMSVFVGAKNGGANNESIVIDYISAFQAR